MPRPMKTTALVALVLLSTPLLASCSSGPPVEVPVTKVERVVTPAPLLEPIDSPRTLVPGASRAQWAGWALGMDDALSACNGRLNAIRDLQETKP